MVKVYVPDTDEAVRSAIDTITQVLNEVRPGELTLRFTPQGELLGPVYKGLSTELLRAALKLYAALLRIHLMHFFTEDLS